MKREKKKEETKKEIVSNLHGLEDTRVVPDKRPN
jgi:hypothetical protein